MRHGRFAADFAGAHLVGDKRLTVVVSALGRLNEALAVDHALEQADDDLRTRFVGKERDIVAHIDVTGIAGSEIMAKAHPALHALNEAVAEAAALGDDRDGPDDMVHLAVAGHEIEASAIGQIDEIQDRIRRMLVEWLGLPHTQLHLEKNGKHHD